MSFVGAPWRANRDGVLYSLSFLSTVLRCDLHSPFVIPLEVHRDRNFGQGRLPFTFRFEVQSLNFLIAVDNFILELFLKLLLFPCVLQRMFARSPGLPVSSSNSLHNLLRLPSEGLGTLGTSTRWLFNGC
jgi:hypothetical protein